MYLPRTVAVQGDRLVLSSICIIRGDRADLVGKSEAVVMGRAPRSGEKLTIDRTTILSRLASCGISKTMVRFTGAKKVVIRRDERTISAEELLKIAGAFLRKSRPGPDGSSWKPAGRVDGLIVPASKNLELKPSVVKHTPAGAAVVKVAAVSGAGMLAQRYVSFRLEYMRRQVVARKDISAGQAITALNVKIVKAASDRPEAPGWTAPMGMIATRRIPKGRIVPDTALTRVRPAIVVRRNKAVTMAIRTGGFIIRTAGQALQDGRPGDMIKVRNVDSNRIVYARVAFDGTVVPAIEERR